MYARYAELLHLLIVLITESSIPTLAAVVAAPMRTLCPAKFCSSKPIALNPSLTLLVNRAFVRGRSSWKRGPPFGP